MNKVELYFGSENGKSGVGVRVLDQEASLADLLDAWQPLCDDTNIYKSYASGHYAECKACTVNCCNTAYVIPDLIAFRKMAEHAGLDYGQFVKTYFQPEKLDIGLLRMKPNPCIFLQDNICSVYPWRSLICRFYICSDILGETEQLIYSLTWTGITATQLFAEEKGLIPASGGAGMSSFDLMFKKLIEEYRNHPGVAFFMKAAEYSQIPLRCFGEPI